MKIFDSFTLCCLYMLPQSDFSFLADLRLVVEVQLPASWQLWPDDSNLSSNIFILTVDWRSIHVATPPVRNTANIICSSPQLYTEHFSIFLLIVSVLQPTALLFRIDLTAFNIKQLFSAKRKKKNTSLINPLYNTCSAPNSRQRLVGEHSGVCSS